MRAFLEGLSIITRPTDACANFFFRYPRTLISSFSIPGKFLLLAYHFDDQFFNTESRKPVGFIFCPIYLVRPLFFLAGFVANGKMNVAGGLDDPVTPSLRPSTGTHHGCAPIHMYR